MKIKKTIAIIILLFTLSSCKVGRFVWHNFADITDYNVFPSREIRMDSSEVFHFKNGETEKLDLKMNNGDSFEDYLKKNKTVAFLVIHNDSIKYENYFNNYNKESIVASFSMAKSFTSFLIGCAIEDKYINSVNDPVTQYIPELKKNGFDSVTIENLLQMTSGLDFNESYFNPFGHAATFYYGKKLNKSSLKLKLKNEPNKTTEYVSGNTQLLGMILDRVLKEKTISQYLEENLWKQIGMEYNATWSIDKHKNGIEKTFCCINARAIDFAKFGRLYLNKGNWEGNQIISRDWVDQSTKIDTSRGSVNYYQYQWWIPNTEGDFTAEGILGQFIFVSPSENLIIVRLGEKYGNVNWVNLFELIKKVVKK